LLAANGAPLKAKRGRVHHEHRATHVLDIFMFVIPDPHHVNLMLPSNSEASMKGTLRELGRECSFSFMNLRSSSHEHL
jgi:hypothetical protein